MDEICIDVKLIKGLRDDEINHVVNRFGEMVETRHGGQYHHAELGQLEHIFEVDGAEWRFSWHEDQFAPFLDADIGGTLDEISGDARRYCEPIVPMLQGATTIPIVRKEPLAIDAPMSDWWW